MAGQMTKDLGRQLTRALAPHALDVLYDHGEGHRETVGKPTLWFGEKYSSATRLGALDIVIVERETDRALVLFEIEETSVSPKQLLGDVFATLFSERLMMPKQNYRNLNHGNYTTLAVLARITRKQHLARLSFLQKRVDGLRPFALKDVILQPFVDAVALEDRANKILKDCGILISC